MSAISEWSQVITKGSVMASIHVDSPWAFVSVFVSVLFAFGLERYPSKEILSDDIYS